MNKSFHDKLKAYSAVAGSVAAVSAGAQVTYTDINPDTVIHDTLIYGLDLNNDAVTDFTFRVSTYGSAHSARVDITGAPNNAVLGSVYSSTYPMPFSLDNGDTIKPNNPNWHAYSLNNGQNYLAAIYGPYQYGNWINVKDKYLGLRIDVAGQYHYGWARLSVSANGDTITIKEYAYEATPDTFIVAGFVTGIPSHAPLNAAHVHAYENTVFVHVPAPQDGGMVSVYDMTGQLIRREEITSGDMRIPLEGEATGVYLVQVQQGESLQTRKIYIH